MDSGGYIKLWRKIFTSPGMEDDWTFRLFLWCIAEARFTDDRQTGIQCGQFCITGDDAAAILRVSRSKFRRGLDRLVTLNCINVETDTRRTTITVCNYKTYQSFSEEPGQRMANGWPTDGQPTLDIKNGKERKERADETGPECPEIAELDASVAKDAANDEAHSPGWLARKWVFRRRGTKSRDELDRARETFEEMIRLGCDPGEIAAEIDRKDRCRTEPIWEFETRLMPRNRKDKPQFGEGLKAFVYGE